MFNFKIELEKLPANEKVFFLSDKPMLEMKKSFVLFGVDSRLSSNIAKEIGGIYLKGISLRELPRILEESLNLDPGIAYSISFEINKRIFNQFPNFFTDSQRLLDEWAKQKSSPLISEDEAYQKVLKLEPWILQNEKEKQQYQATQRKAQAVYQSNLENIPLSDALKKYPELGEQLVTSTHIRLKNYPEPARPSVKNWLSDYTMGLGYDHHDSIIRGDYLFKSENGKTLNQTDREKLSQLLRSFDDKTPLKINTTTKQVVFSVPTVNLNQEPSKKIISNFPASPTGGQFPNYNVKNKEEAPANKFHPIEKTTPSSFHSNLPNQINLKRVTESPIQPPDEKPAEEVQNPRQSFYTSPPARPEDSLSSFRKAPEIIEAKPEPPKPKPMYIRPVSNGNGRYREERELPGNVVNLKEQ